MSFVKKKGTSTVRFVSWFVVSNYANLNTDLKLLQNLTLILQIYSLTIYCMKKTPSPNTRHVFLNNLFNFHDLSLTSTKPFSQRRVSHSSSYRLLLVCRNILNIMEYKWYRTLNWLIKIQFPQYYYFVQL